MTETAPDPGKHERMVPLICNSFQATPVPLLDAHVILDRGHALDALRDLDRLAHGRIGTDEAAELHRALEGLDVNLCRLDLRIIDQGRLHFGGDPAVAEVLPGAFLLRAARATQDRHKGEGEDECGDAFQLFHG